MSKGKSFRLQVKAWLDISKPQENDLAVYVDELRQQRQWASTFRDSLRLIRDLRAGNTAVLFELFPQLQPTLDPPALSKLFAGATVVIQNGQPTAPPVASAKTGFTPPPPPPPNDTPIAVSTASDEQPKIGGFARSVAKVRAIQ